MSQFDRIYNKIVLDIKEKGYGLKEMLEPNI